MNLIRLYAVCSVLLIVAVAQETTIRIALSSEEIDDVTFDASRISSVDVSRWIQLSEEGPYLEADFGTAPCFGVPIEKSKEQSEIEDAQAGQEKLRKRIGELNEDHFPAELADVVSYLKRRLSFWLWLDSKKLEFLTTSDVGILRSRFEKIDPEISCSAVLQRIRRAKTQEEARHLACFDWHKCVLHAGDKQIGPYPKKAWQSFLAAYGIREQILSTEED